MKKLFVFWFVMMFVFVSGCQSQVQKIEMADDEGNFRVQYVDETKTECALGGYTEKYATSGFCDVATNEYLFLPSKINGVRVVKLGTASLMHANNDNITLRKFKKIYFPYWIRESNTLLQSNFVQKLFFSGTVFDTSKIFVGTSIFDGVECIYIPEANQEFCREKYGRTFRSANVVYYLNYAESDRPIWNIDDYDYGTLITVMQPIPKREGYTFDGWYKETECINKWNFETDKLPEELTDENGTVFQETQLFASWIKN